MTDEEIQEEIERLQKVERKIKNELFIARLELQARTRSRDSLRICVLSIRNMINNGFTN